YRLSIMLRILSRVARGSLGQTSIRRAMSESLLRASSCASVTSECRVFPPVFEIVREQYRPLFESSESSENACFSGDSSFSAFRSWQLFDALGGGCTADFTADFSVAFWKSALVTRR